MSKRRESDDRPPARRKRPLPAWALALVVAVPVLVCGGGSMAVIAALSAVSRAAERKLATDNTATKVWDEDELSRAVVGKTVDEVMEIMGGRPDWVVGNVDKDEVAELMYENRLWDRVTAKPRTASILFNDGRATKQVRN